MTNTINNILYHPYVPRFNGPVSFLINAIERISKVAGIGMAYCKNIKVDQPNSQTQLKGYQKYKHINDSNRNKERTFIIPPKRHPATGYCESSKSHSVAQGATMVDPKVILKVHPMKFLQNSPFVKPIEDADYSLVPDYIWDDASEDLIKEYEAIAVSKEGKHIILQQSATSCVYTCVSMLALDHQKTPDYQKIKVPRRSDSSDCVIWFKQIGLTPLVTHFPKGDNPLNILLQQIKEYGPGIVSIGGHDIVLDEICVEKNYAIIRDPFHGWMITMKLDALLSRVNQHGESTFVQVEEGKKFAFSAQKKLCSKCLQTVQSVVDSPITKIISTGLLLWQRGFFAGIATAAAWGAYTYYKKR